MQKEGGGCDHERAVGHPCGDEAVLCLGGGDSNLYIDGLVVVTTGHGIKCVCTHTHTSRAGEI